jgi:hypothetical protein
MSICKASEIPRNEAYIEVRRRWPFSDSLLRCLLSFAEGRGHE